MMCTHPLAYAITRQGIDRGAGLAGGAERMTEEERRRGSEKERNSSYKEFQGKVEKETEKVGGGSLVLTSSTNGGIL